MSTKTTLQSTPISNTDIKKRCCCNCGHNQRIPQSNQPLFVDHNECDLDGHRIGYVECFEHWCRHWKKDKS